MKRKGLILAMFVMPNSTLIMHMNSMSKVCGIVFRAVRRSENPVGHCVEMDFTRTLKPPLNATEVFEVIFHYSVYAFAHYLLFSS